MNGHAWQGKIVVAGLGSSGLSMLRFFVAEGCGVCLRAKITDERRAYIAAELPTVTFADGDLAAALVGAEVLALSPGVPSRQPSLQHFPPKAAWYWAMWKCLRTNWRLRPMPRYWRLQVPMAKPCLKFDRLFV